MRLTRIQLDGCSDSWVVLVEDFMSSRNTTSAPPVSLDNLEGRKTHETGYCMTYCAAPSFFGKEKNASFRSAWKAQPAESAEIVVCNRRMRVSRKIALFGDRPYVFSGNTLEPRDMDEVPLFSAAMERIGGFLGAAEHRAQLGMAAETNYCLPTALVNWYASGKRERIGAHSDSVAGLVPEYPICCVSWGVQRRFVLTHKASKAKTKFWLKDGDMLIMGQSTQSTHTHEVPAPLKTEPREGKRISFTVRCYTQ